VLAPSERNWQRAIQHEHWISLEEYHEIERNSEVRYEYADGHVYERQGETIAHSRVAMNMVAKLHDHLWDKTCDVANSIVKVLPLDGENPSYYPDATVTCNPDDYHDDSMAIRSPHLIVEVLSPLTFARDRGEKLYAYQACKSCEEYVLVSTHHQAIEVYHRESANIWTLTRYMAQDSAQLASIGLIVPVAEIYVQTHIPSLELPASALYAY